MYTGNYPFIRKYCSQIFSFVIYHTVIRNVIMYLKTSTHPGRDMTIERKTIIKKNHIQYYIKLMFQYRVSTSNHPASTIVE